jgi:hypothetical protein
MVFLVSCPVGTSPPGPLRSDALIYSFHLGQMLSETVIGRGSPCASFTASTFEVFQNGGGIA